MGVCISKDSVHAESHSSQRLQAAEYSHISGQAMPRNNDDPIAQITTSESLPVTEANTKSDTLIPFQKVDAGCQTQAEWKLLVRDETGLADELKNRESALLKREQSVMERELEIQHELQRAESESQVRLGEKPAVPASKLIENNSNGDEEGERAVWLALSHTMIRSGHFSQVTWCKCVRYLQP
jgi:hypothetical protein